MTSPTPALERAPLASCPFCGCDDPELHHDGSASNFLQGGCRNPDCVLFDCFPGAYRDHDHFAEWWNRRPLEDALARHAEAAKKRVSELEASLAEVLPYTEAERLYEAAAVRCGKTRDPINKAVRRARALLTPIAEGR